MLDRRGKRSSHALTAILPFPVRLSKVFDWHSRRITERNQIFLRTVCQLKELFPFWSILQVNNARQVVRTLLPISKSEVESFLSWSFVKVLSVERMPLLIVFGKCNIPTVVPLIVIA